MTDGTPTPPPPGTPTPPPPGGRGAPPRTDLEAHRKVGLRRTLPHVPPQVGIPIALALVLLLLGPRVVVDESFDPVEVPEDVVGWLDAADAELSDLLPGENREIVWADSSHARTPLALVYLHGFSADRHELDPVPRRVARELGANLYFTRLTGHARGGVPLGDASANDWFRDAAEAVAVGRAIGGRVVLMGLSTGATLAVWAAARPELAEDIAGLVLVSPNFHPLDHNARLLLLPWGGALGRAVLGPERCFDVVNDEQARHWDECYPTRALLPMMGMVERVRTMDLAGVSAPAVILYSPEDQVVDPVETEAAFERLGSDPKRLIAFDSPDSPDHHVLAGDILAPRSNDAMVDAVVEFLRRVR